MQNTLRPKLIRVLEIFVKKFGADFIQLLIQDEEEWSTEDVIYYSHTDISTADIHKIIDFAGKHIKGKKAEIYESGVVTPPESSDTLPHFSTLAFIPVDITDESRGIIILGFVEPVAELPENYLQTGYELMYTHRGMLFRHALINEESRNDFLLDFGKMLADVQDSQQLCYLLQHTLKPFLSYTDCAIFLLDECDGMMHNICFDTDTLRPFSLFRKSIDFAGLSEHDFSGDSLYDTNNGLFNLEKASESKWIKPFLRANAELENKKGRVYNLYSGIDIAGSFILLFDETQPVTYYLHKIFPLIINHLITAVTRIRSLEEIRKQKIEREILQSINTEIAFNKDKKDLLRALNPKLKLLFDYVHHFVVVVNDDQLTVTGLIGDFGSRVSFHPRYRQVVPMKFAISDQVFNKVLLSNDPIVFDLKEIASRQLLPEYMVINMDVGNTTMVMVSLRVGAKIIGIWIICLDEHQRMSPYQLELFKGISHQLSIACENIMAGDIVREKTKEQEFLFQISADITAIRERKDLDKFFNLTLKGHLSFDEAVIMIRNEDEMYSRFLYSPEMYGLDPGHDPDFLAEQYTNRNSVFNRLLSAGSVIVYEMESLIMEESMPSFLKTEYAAGIRTKVGVKLRKDKADIGVVFFNFRQVIDLSVQEMELYHTIAFHLSTAVCNVLSHEEIRTRERERDLLLSLSTEMAAIRNAKQLISIITEKLQDFLGFSHISIGTLNEDSETYSIFLFDPDSISKNHPQYQAITEAKYSTNDGVTNKILMSAVPLNFDLEELAAQNGLPELLRMNLESGVKQAIGVRLSKELLSYGFLIIFFERKSALTSSKSSLINGLGNQISIAVSNIIVNQELKRRVEEERKLLMFSSELRSVNDIPLLIDILKVQLRELFQISEFMISVLSEDQKYQQTIFYNEGSSFAGHPDFLKISDGYQQIADSVFQMILNSNDAVILDIASLSDSYDKIGYLSQASHDQHEGVVGAVMKLGQQPIGFILFEHPNLFAMAKQQQLFESISSQIAIVISNIFSHQKVETQLKEIEIYKQQLEEEKIYLTEEIETIHNYTEIIGESTALKETFRLVTQVSPSDSTVLILGETGTGKELIARAIHNNSPRKNKMMVKVNCAALPVNLIESELFGHEKGSFTGAVERRLGKFELANHGTLFLDEIGEMPVDLQVKLLRALQEKEIERVGGKETIKVDVRIIAATNRDLEKEIDEGRFRNDLFYRLNIFPISLPPLRERKQDIESLAMHFIQQFNKNCGKNITSISSKALKELQDYHWPGNIRELEHLIERSVLLASGNTLKELLLPAPEEQLVFKSQAEEFTLKTIDENEIEYILKILKHCNGRIAGSGGAAEILGVPPTTLNSKIKRLGIKREHTM